MNCKPGDLAFQIGSEGAFDSQSLGWVVEVIGAGCDWSDFGDLRHHWLCRKAGGGLLPFQDPDGETGWSDEVEIPDAHLMPIRKQPEQDETLTWAGKPQGVTA